MEINQTEIAQVAQTTSATVPTPAMSLLSLLEGFLAGYIQTAVDKRVAEIMQTKENINTINDVLEERIREIARDEAEDVTDDAIRSHENTEEHISEDDVSSLVQGYVDDYDFNDAIRGALGDAVTEAIEEVDFDEKVRDALNSVLESATIKLEM